MTFIQWHLCSKLWHLESFLYDAALVANKDEYMISYCTTLYCILLYCSHYVILTFVVIVMCCLCNQFEQHPDLMQKLVDTAADDIVYAGTERHLGVDFEVQIHGCAEKENKLGKALMEIRKVSKNSE